MLEKLLENWLDSASERSYQPVFVQMLSAQGYSVVHSTRHAALEFGKDVLAVAPDKKGCAYQLKGNPGGRLGLSAFRDLQPQLVQLMSQGVVYPGFPTGRHRSYLVSNGYFDEEVQRAVDDLNRGPYLSKLTLLSRGDLLNWSKSLGSTLWPSELPDTQLMLKLFLADPRDLLPIETVSQLLEKMLRLDADAKTVKRQQMDRAIPAAALLVGICSARFAEQENHLAVAWAWTIFLVMSIGALERHKLNEKGPAARAIKLAESAWSDALAALWREVKDRDDDIVQGSPFTDPEILAWRKIVMNGALSCLAIKHERTPCLEVESYETLREWLKRKDLVPPIFGVWGESAVASLIPWMLWFYRHEATSLSDSYILYLANMVILRNQHESASPLPNLYSSFESVYRQVTFSKPPRPKETYAGHSHTALLLFHLLVRVNLKGRCRDLWPLLTRVSHRYMIPDQSWQYCLAKMREGVDETRLLAPQGDWEKIKAEALKDCSASMPPLLADRPWLLGMWWQVVPPRMTPDACRVFANSILPGWGV